MKPREAGGTKQDSVSMKEIQSTTVKRPADDVFRYLTNPTNVPQWSAVVADVEELRAPQGVAVGTKVRANLHVLGMNLTVQGEVTEFEPQERRAVLQTQIPGGGGIETHFWVEDLNGSAVVYFDERVAPPSWLTARGISDRLIARTVEATTLHSLTNIREILEGAEEAKVQAAQVHARQDLPAEMLR
jgi:uncharacterized protein YndB with AHSA1/START domain